jgi:hypothetical protein
VELSGGCRNLIASRAVAWILCAGMIKGEKGEIGMSHKNKKTALEAAG